MTESSDTSDTPAKPQDYAGLRTELAARRRFHARYQQAVASPGNQKYRWELHSYGLPEGYDKLIATNIILC
jgi:hypothetical protein